MNFYIKITQTSGAGVLEIRFPYFKNSTLWYKSGDLAFTDIQSSTFKYEVRYTADAIDTAVLKLEFYATINNQLIKTVNITGNAIDDTPVLVISLENLHLGREITTDAIISSSISVTAENLIDDIVVTGDADNSIFISVDDGITYYKGSIPIQAIAWVTANTFNMKIKRVYTNTLGYVTQALTFTNAGIISTLNVISLFDNFLTAPSYATEPTGAKGTMYFDSVRGHFYGYNGTTWKQLDN